MQDIARAAGVSTITVSRALGDGTVNPDTRLRVMQAAEEMGYQFNVAARNLRLQRTSSVAVVIEMQQSAERPISDPYPLSLLGGIIEELSLADYSAMLSTAEKFMKLPPAVDAVILLGQGQRDDSVALIDRCNLPLVIWGSVRGDHGRHVVVGSDNVAGGRLAAARFIELGRKRAIFLGEPGYAEGADRLDGFAEVFAADGGELVEAVRCEFTLAAGEAAMTTAIARHGSAFNAVFAASDGIAMGAIRALKNAGRRVPEDVTVIGFDDAANAQLFAPPLTTIHQDWNEGGRLLARKALALGRNEHAAAEMMPVRLVVRST